MKASHTRRVLTGAVLALLCGPLLVGQNLPDDKGKVEFVHNCTACHRADMVLAAPKTPDGWRKSVDEMAARGTDGTKEDLDNIVLYLDKYFSTEKTAPAVKPVAPSATPKLDTLTKLGLTSASLRRYVSAGFRS